MSEKAEKLSRFIEFFKSVPEEKAALEYSLLTLVGEDELMSRIRGEI